MKGNVTTSGLCRPRISMLARTFLNSTCVLCLALMVGILVSACDQPRAVASRGAPPSATIQPGNALPTFTDWRAAYLGAGGRLHAVSLDGKTDVSGQLLPDLSSYGLSFACGGISPDGHALTYDAAGLDIVALSATESSTHIEKAFARGLSWSTDGSQLALDQGLGVIAVASTRDGTPRIIQGSPPNTIGDFIGWIDSTHVAVTDIAGATWVSTQHGTDGYSTSISVASLDITNGHLRVIATLRSPGLEDAIFSISPDGTKLLVSNRGYRDYPYIPLVDEIDVASGAITPLPTINRATGSGFARMMAWQKGTDIVAVSVYNSANPWILDLRHDTAKQLPVKGFVGGWSPDNRTLVLTTGYQIGIGEGPFTLTALTFGPGGQIVSSTMLTQAAMTFPFIGFVRTA